MKLLITSSLLFVMTLCTAQTAQLDFRKHIVVSGSAEMSVQPDEVELEIVFESHKKTGKAVEYADIETQFKAIMKKNNIKEEAVTFHTSESWYWWYWWNYRYNRYTRSVKLKIDNKTDMLRLIKELDEHWSIQLRIVNTSNKDIQRYRKEVKIEAIKAAKLKAEYLLESVGEKAGGILSVEEQPENNYDYWYPRQNNVISNSVISGSSATEEGIAGITKIKLRYEIKVKFEIK